MILYPAIDIKNKKVVRLRQGKFDDVTEYGDDPLETAKKWESLGAQWLHVVDLDGALDGTSENTSIIKQIAKSLSIPVQTGGGIRSEAKASELIEAGIKRVILGTKAIEDEAFLNTLLKKYPAQVAVSLDCNDGYVAQRGWTETSNVKATDLAKKLEDKGLQCLVYTDIKTDGMLTGPNLKALTELASVTNIGIIASGGIKNLDNIRDLLAIESKGIIGAITGRAIYEGTLDLKEALNLCLQNG